MDDGDRELIARICEALDGLPLAIELAAGRVDVLGLSEIESQLADRFASLGGRRGRGRARTLATTLDWSYGLLDEDEQRFFEDLSVFHGGFNHDAAVAVTDVARVESLDLLQRLMDKSLLVSSGHRTGRRFRMLETVRQYAQGRLVDRGDAGATNDRHLTWMRGLAQRHHELFGEDRHREAMALLDDDQYNLRAAMDWAASGGDPAIGLEMFVRTEGWWRHTISIREGWR
ncbi:MAG: hypothetical protein P8N02_12280 [Actinomycetota bacterium]|nr:hypothetical protein [Actinomycetota bacterium]